MEVLDRRGYVQVIDIEALYEAPGILFVDFMSKLLEDQIEPSSKLPLLKNVQFCKTETIVEYDDVYRSENSSSPKAKWSKENYYN